MFTYTTKTGQVTLLRSVNGVHAREQVFGLASMVDFGENEFKRHDHARTQV